MLELNGLEVSEGAIDSCANISMRREPVRSQSLEFLRVGLEGATV